MNTISLALVATLSAAPLASWADANPDFDDDAKPILRQQPGLLPYVEHTFDVKETGSAKYPGDDDRRPTPPYIFRARPSGTHGAFNLRLLIQPGQPGHILNVVDITKVHVAEPPASGPNVASRPPAPPPASSASRGVQVPELSGGPVDQPPLNGAPSAKAPVPSTSQPNEPTADTPSGPINDSSSNPGQNPASTQPSLAPPPDPAPPAQ